MDLDPAAQLLCGRFHIRPHEARVQDQGVYVDTEADRTVDVRLDALVEIVEAGLVGHSAEMREQRGVSHVHWLVHRVREAES